MELLQCDICKVTSVKGDIGWKRIENASRIDVLNLGELPINHICDGCWTTMLGAVR